MLAELAVEVTDAEVVGVARLVGRDDLVLFLSVRTGCANSCSGPACRGLSNQPARPA